MFRSDLAGSGLGGLIVRIQAHPSRREIVNELLERVRPLGEAWYDDSGSPFEGYIGTLRFALAAKDPFTHAVVLQDDAIICRNFTAADSRIARSRPDDVIQLFTGELKGKTLKDYRQAQLLHQNYSQVYFREIHHVVALLWPRDALISFLDWWNGEPRVPGPMPPLSDDSVFGYWARTTHRQIWATVPSLVQHPSRDVDVSLVGNQGKGGRQAIVYIGDDDPLEIEW